MRRKGVRQVVGGCGGETRRGGGGEARGQCVRGTWQSQLQSSSLAVSSYGLVAATVWMSLCWAHGLVQWTHQMSTQLNTTHRSRTAAGRTAPSNAPSTGGAPHCQCLMIGFRRRFCSSVLKKRKVHCSITRLITTCCRIPRVCKRPTRGWPVVQETFSGGKDAQAANA